jgi:hypothetical protein
MNRYEMIMAAADGIEKNPQRFDFATSKVVTNGVDPRCILGEMWYQAGIYYQGTVGMIAPQILGIDEGTFFRMLQVAHGEPFDLHDATLVPAALRKVAKRYEGIPGEVLEIFTPLQKAYGPMTVQFVNA